MDILYNGRGNTAGQPDILDEDIFIRPLFTITPRFIILLGNLNEQFLWTLLAEEAHHTAEAMRQTYDE